MSEAEVWDPHFGTRPFRSEPVDKPAEGFACPTWLKSVVGTTLLAGFAGIAIGAVFSETLLFVSIPVVAIGMGLLILFDKLGRVQDKLRWFYFQLAARNGWDFAYYQPNQLGRKAARAVGMEDVAGDPNTETDPDPRVAWARKRIPELLRPGKGSWAPFTIQAGYWGNLDEGTPFWLGLTSLAVNATLGTKAKRRDDAETEAPRGTQFQLAFAYPLPRDTGLRLAVLPKGMAEINAAHLETESIEFNKTFAVDLDHTLGPYDEGRREALRLLTPATQASLIDLHERLGARMIVDGGTVFLSGEAKINIQPAEAAADELNTLVHAFENAALAMRDYLD